jgi:hypothetical protein
VPALTAAQHIWWKQQKHSVAYQYAVRAAELAPQNPYCWSHLGLIEDALYRFNDAEKCFDRAMSVCKNDAQKGGVYTNYACMLVNKGDWGRALSMAKKAYALKPESPKAKANLGMAMLALGQWKEAWPLYDAVIGFDNSRRKMQYVNEPVWDGSPGKHVVVYEEQGVGDAITFMSMVPDLIRDCASVVIDCSPKLAGLFRRSFPQAAVYGSILGHGDDWRPRHRIDASVSMGGLGKFYRPSPAACPGGAYLKPDPERALMWRSLFDFERARRRPVIGIAWSGGVAWTADRHRRVTLEQLLPLFAAVDAVWVSLQYKDAAAEIAAFKDKCDVDIRQYPYGTLTADYDDTAAMVSALDLIVSVPTSVVHLAGAIRTPCIAMKAPISCWKFASGLPFHRDAVTLIEHEESWDATIVRASEAVKGRFAC